MFFLVACPLSLATTDISLANEQLLAAVDSPQHLSPRKYEFPSGPWGHIQVLHMSSSLLHCGFDSLIHF